MATSRADNIIDLTPPPFCAHPLLYPMSLSPLHRFCPPRSQSHLMGLSAPLNPPASAPGARGQQASSFIQT